MIFFFAQCRRYYIILIHIQCCGILFFVDKKNRVHDSLTHLSCHHMIFFFALTRDVAYIVLTEPMPSYCLLCLSSSRYPLYMAFCIFITFLQDDLTCLDALKATLFVKIIVTLIGPIKTYGLYYCDIGSDYFLMITLFMNCHYIYGSISMAILCFSYLSLIHI